MLFKSALVCALAASLVSAQRPSGVSICDYYTGAVLKQNTPANQYKLLTVLVNTVVIGNYSACSVGSGLPGILAPANYGGEQVQLLPYFNGCLKSTNNNGQPSYMNFLDSGGAAALKQNQPAFSPSSNQYGLLTHLYQFFGKLLACSGYGEMGFPSYMGDPSMAQVHYFMDLDSAEVGYFISQVGAAATCLGVSTADATAVGGVLMQYFGYRCSPPRAITGAALQQSICEDCSCPLHPNGASCTGIEAQCPPNPPTNPTCAAAASSTSPSYPWHTGSGGSGSAWSKGGNTEDESSSGSGWHKGSPGSGWQNVKV